jgi:hypothetical protein
MDVARISNQKFGDATDFAMSSEFDSNTRLADTVQCSELLKMVRKNLRNFV